MKRKIVMMLLFLLLTGCALAEAPAVETMQAEVRLAMADPAAYEGQWMRVRGTFNYGEATGRATVILCDNTACCELGLQFVPAGEVVYPDDYPPLYADIVVTGRFEAVEQDGETVCRLADATVETE